MVDTRFARVLAGAFAFLVLTGTGAARTDDVAPTNVTPPSIDGSPIAGSTVTVDPGTWAGTPPITFKYTWNWCSTGGGCGFPAAVTTSPTITLGPGGDNQVLLVFVTAMNAAGSTEYHMDRFGPIPAHSAPSPPLLLGAFPASTQSTPPTTIPGGVTVTFEAPVSDGGSPITSYTVTASPGGLTATGPAGPITLTGLTVGASYTLTVAATNAIGTGGPSRTSDPVTAPAAPPGQSTPPTGGASTGGGTNGGASSTGSGSSPPAGGGASSTSSGSSPSAGGDTSSTSASSSAASSTGGPATTSVPVSEGASVVKPSVGAPAFVVGKPVDLHASTPTLSLTTKLDKAVDLHIVLRDSKGHAIATWTRHARSGTRTLALRIPAVARHPGRDTLRVTRAGAKAATLPLSFRA
jgi:hypothetical protein